MIKISKTVQILFLLSFISSQAIYPISGVGVSGKAFTIYSGDGAYQQDYTTFQSVYQVDNTVNQIVDMDFSSDLDGVDVLLLPANGELGADNLAAIESWFDQGGKLLWVAGDSDFGGLFIAETMNAVLEEVGSVLRLDAGAVDDIVWNDGQSYRVKAVNAGDGPIATAIVKGISEVTAPFHGPTSIYYVDESGNSQDLRLQEPANVEGLLYSSSDATVIDQDVSLGLGDYYLVQETKGDYPLMAIEIFDKSAVIVSGEANFGDYKNMYGEIYEASGDPHVGAIIVDNVIEYYFTNINETPDTSEDESLNFNIPFLLISIVGILVYRSRKNKL